MNVNFFLLYANPISHMQDSFAPHKSFNTLYISSLYSHSNIIKAIRTSPLANYTNHIFYTKDLKTKLDTVQREIVPEHQLTATPSLHLQRWPRASVYPASSLCSSCHIVEIECSPGRLSSKKMTATGNCSCSDTN